MRTKCMDKDSFKSARMALGLTQGQLADALLISLRAVQYMESGERSITRRTAAQITALEANQIAVSPQGGRNVV
jgi:transcriptional regulator with XRE-family HTH domain